MNDHTGKTVILTGGTGMVGGIVLQHCLADEAIGKVISITRKSTNTPHPKLQEVIHQDFSSFDNISSLFQDIDAAYFCLGAYTGAVSDEVFKKITYDFTVAFADTLATHSPNATFCLLSGAGADQTEKSRVSFAKYKGMAENYLKSKNFGALYLFRPGYIYPVTKRAEPNVMYTFSRILYPLIRIFGQNMSIKSTELGEAIFRAGLYGANSTVLENKDILKSLEWSR